MFTHYLFEGVDHFCLQIFLLVTLYNSFVFAIISGPNNNKPKYQGGILTAYNQAAIAKFLVIPKISPKEGIKTKAPKIINRIDKAIRDQPVVFLIFKKNVFTCYNSTCRLICQI